MNIVIISTIDTRGGGSKIPWNIMQNLKSRGHSVSMFVGYKYSSDISVHKIPLNPFYYRLSKIFANDLTFSRSSSIFKTHEYKNADIINCHNIHSGFFNWKDFAKITKEKKVVWDIHDLWPITSGCTDIYHCSFDKPKRVFGCLWDNRSHLLKQKKMVYENSNFDIVVQSHWLKSKLENSIIGCQPIHFINCSIDTEIFKPYDKKSAREELKLPLNKKIILSIAGHGLSHTLKGSEYVKKMMECYQKNEGVLFVAVGGNKEQKKLSPAFNLVETGYINDENLLAKYYSAADLLLYPSLGDNLALAVLEAMSCGLPVVTFNTCGIPEAVEGLGYIAQYKDAEDLKHGVKYMLSLSDSELQITSRKCRERIENQYSLTKMISEHEKLFLKILNEPTSQNHPKNRF